jgi:hypothetical protein
LQFPFFQKKDLKKWIGPKMRRKVWRTGGKCTSLPKVSKWRKTKILNCYIYTAYTFSAFNGHTIDIYVCRLLSNALAAWSSGIVSACHRRLELWVESRLGLGW